MVRERHIDTVPRVRTPVPTAKLNQPPGRGLGGRSCSRPAKGQRPFTFRFTRDMQLLRKYMTSTRRFCFVVNNNQTTDEFLFKNHKKKFFSPTSHVPGIVLPLILSCCWVPPPPMDVAHACYCCASLDHRVHVQMHGFYWLHVDSDIRYKPIKSTKPPTINTNVAPFIFRAFLPRAKLDQQRNSRKYDTQRNSPPPTPAPHRIPAQD